MPSTKKCKLPWQQFCKCIVRYFLGEESCSVSGTSVASTECRLSQLASSLLWPAGWYRSSSCDIYYVLHRMPGSIVLTLKSGMSWQPARRPCRQSGMGDEAWCRRLIDWFLSLYTILIHTTGQLMRFGDIFSDTPSVLSLHTTHCSNSASHLIRPTPYQYLKYLS